MSRIEEHQVPGWSPGRIGEAPFGSLTIFGLVMVIYADLTELEFYVNWGEGVFVVPPARPTMTFRGSSPAAAAVETLLGSKPTAPFVPDAGIVEKWFGIKPTVHDRRPLTKEQAEEEDVQTEAAWEEEDRREMQEQARLSRVLRPLVGGLSDDGSTHVDPSTGARYFECVCCGQYFSDISDMHSGGECNLCHAVNKDD